MRACLGARLEMNTVKRNIIICLRCGDIVESKHVHDFVRCKCGAVFTDGGNEYWRRGGDLEAIVSVTNEELIREWDKRNAEKEANR